MRVFGVETHPVLGCNQYQLSVDICDTAWSKERDGHILLQGEHFLVKYNKVAVLVHKAQERIPIMKVITSVKFLRIDLTERLVGGEHLI